MISNDYYLNLDKIRTIIPMNLVEIGQLIQKRRDSLQIKQEDLAELSGITTKTIYMLEKGKGNPSFSTLVIFESVSA